MQEAIDYNKILATVRSDLSKIKSASLGDFSEDVDSIKNSIIQDKVPTEWNF